MRKDRLLFLFGLLCGIYLVFSCWYQLHDDVHFYTDVARNYHLLQEIDLKGFVLLGPRTSTPGIFHGPAWIYTIYPAYWLGGGNPIVVGWYWILLVLGFLWVSYQIAQRLYGESSAKIYVLILWSVLVLHTKALNNPHGALFLVPVFYYLMVRFLRTKKIGYLIVHLLVGGLMVQYEMAVGAPLLILSFILAVLVLGKKNRRFLVGAIIAGFVPLVTFVLFDMRHEMLQSMAIISYLKSDHPLWSAFYADMIVDRFKNFVDLQLLSYSTPLPIKLLVFVVLSTMWVSGLKTPKLKGQYLLFGYYYVGFYSLSLLNEGGLLYHFVYPLFPLTMLVFSSFIRGRYRNVAIVLFLVVLMANGWEMLQQSKQANTFIGYDQDSWKFLLGMTSDVYSQDEDEFGYFVYSPDAFAYEPRYAMIYGNRIFGNKAAEFSKRRITYVLIAPPAPDNPYLSPEWWIRVQLRINGEPITKQEYPNGYRVLKYRLTDKELTSGYEESVNLGIHFR